MKRSRRVYTPGHYVLCLALSAASPVLSKAGTKAENTLTIQDNQNHIWRFEAEKTLPVTPASQAEIIPDGVKIVAQRGVTLWFEHPLKGNYTLTFDRKILKPEGALRVSDMNIFWNAHEKNGALPHVRNGTLSAYNSLVLEYAGIGGNNNTTTRFRHYDGSGARILLQESNAPADMLKPDHIYHTVISVHNGVTTLFLDGKKFFSAPVNAASPGYFGIRTVGSQQEITHFSLSA